MTRPNPSLMRRIALAISSFFAILARPEFAAGIERLQAGESAVPAAPPPPAPATPPTPTPTPAPASSLTPTPAPTPAPAVAQAAAALQQVPEAAALQLLGLFQREARFVDFLQEDVAGYSDAEIGAAARLVHEGCRKVLHAHFTLAPVRGEAEGSRVTLPAGFDAAAVRVTGNVVGQPPFTGTLGHRGWRATDSRLPRLAAGHDLAVIAQAEVEL